MCTSSGLTGIILDEFPGIEIIKETKHETWQKVIKSYIGKNNPGVASVFWARADYSYSSGS